MTETTEVQSTKPVGATNTRVAWVLGIALILFVVATCVNPVPESDLFWQLRTGRWIFDHHAVPHSDGYSWTRPGTPWVVHEWLTFVLFDRLYAALGFGGLYFYIAGLLGLTFALLYRRLLKETRSPLTSFGLGMLAAVLVGPFFQPRPQLFTYLFLVLTVDWLLDARRGPTPSPSLKGREFKRAGWWLIPLYILWANVHAGVLVGVGIIGLFVVVDGLSKVLKKTDGGLAGAWPILLGCLAATLVTPYGIHEYQDFAATISNTTMLNLLAEWASPDFHQAYGKQVEILLAVIAYAMFFTRLRRDPAEAILLAGLIYEGLAANRNVPLLALSGSMLVARHLQSALSSHLYHGQSEVPEDSVIGSRPPGTILGLLAVLVVFCGVKQASDQVRSFGPSTGPMLDRVGRTIVVYGTYPDQACAFIEREQFPSTMRMLNMYDQGGFLIWRMPERPVYIDSRADVYFGGMLDEYEKVDHLHYDWREILARNPSAPAPLPSRERGAGNEAHGVDFIVASNSERQVKQYLPAPDWALVYADDGDLSVKREDEGKTDTLIFVRRSPEFADLIARCRRDCPAWADVVKRYGEWASVK